MKPNRCRVWLSNFGLWYWACDRCINDRRTPPGGVRESLVRAGDAARAHARLVHRHDIEEIAA